MAKLGILLQCVSQEKEQILKTDSKILQPDFPAPNPRTHYVEIDQVSNSTDELHLLAIGSSPKPHPIKCEVLIEGKPITMEVNF